MVYYDELKNLQADLIRKALGGSAFLAPSSADPIAALTTYTAAEVGPPAVEAKIDMTPLPAGYGDLGYLTDDGIGQSNETSNSEITSFQSVTPTRTDLVSDTDTITVTCQETKLLTIGLFTGATLSADSLAANTSELSIPKPERPVARTYRLLTLAVDNSSDGEIYIGRFYPNVKVTGKGDQVYSKADQALVWPVTFTAQPDGALGYSVRYLFGGAGWAALTAKMGFTV